MGEDYDMWARLERKDPKLCTRIGEHMAKKQAEIDMLKEMLAEAERMIQELTGESERSDSCDE